MMDIYFDFETQSSTDLIKYGLSRMANCTKTIVACLGWAIDDGDVQIWKRGDDIPAELFKAVESDGARLFAHNAEFDITIWDKVWVRQLRDENGLESPVYLFDRDVVCTAVWAASCGLPRSLEKCAKALKLSEQKDNQGAKAMHVIMNRPELTYADMPHVFETVYEYCKQDIETLRGIKIALDPRNQLAREAELYKLHRKINSRGLGVDIESAQLMDSLHHSLLAKSDRQVEDLTEGQAGKVTQKKRITEFLQAKGLSLESLDIGTVTGLLDSKTLPKGDVLRVLEILQEASRAPKKPASIINGNTGGRMRQALLYCGAVPTGRWAGSGCAGAQLQNIARPRAGVKPADCRQILADMRLGEAAFSEKHPQPLAALADAQRALYCAPEGRVLVCADASGIEARILPWLANDIPILNAFSTGEDVYIKTAAAMWKVDSKEISKDDPRRQMGKIARLASQFGGGASALQVSAAMYGLEMDEKEANELVRLFRSTSPYLFKFIGNLEAAALYACDSSMLGKRLRLPVGVGLAKEMIFSHHDGALHVYLPSGRPLVYQGATIEARGTTPYVTYINPTTGVRVELNRRILANNATQGLARDFFANAMLVADEKGAKIVHHVHDEMLVECLESEADEQLGLVKSALTTVPDFLEGIPLACEGFISKEWRK